MKLALTLLPLFAIGLLAACGGEDTPPVPTVAPSPTLEVSLTPAQLPNVCLPNPDAATPESQIIDQPRPFDLAVGTLTVRGRIVASEATFHVAIYDPAGDSIIEISAMSEQTEVGELAPYSVDLSFDVGGPTEACLWIFEESPRDGSPVNVGQVPVFLLPPISPGDEMPIPASVPTNVDNFLARFGGTEEVAIVCGYNADTALVQCGETFLQYELEDGPSATFDRCRLFHIEGVAVYLACVVDAPAQRVIYGVPPIGLPQP